MAAYLWIVLAWLAAWCPVATAAIVYSAGQSEFTVGPGHRIVVPIYLDFDGADTVLLTNEHGIFSAGVTVTVTDSMPNQTPVQIVAPADISPNVADFADPFGPVIVLNGPLSAQILVLADAFGSAGVVGQALGGGGRRVLIGSIAFTAGLNLGEVSTIHLGDYNVNTSDTVTWESAVDLDPAIVGSDIVIRVVPDLGYTVLRVDGANGSGTGDGAAWGAAAFKFLGDAMATASTLVTGGETVQLWIAEGTYATDQDRDHPTGTGDRLAYFALKSRMSLYGGFAGNETDLNQRDLALHVTTLSGPSPEHILRVADTDASPHVDGLTVMGAFGTNAGLGAGAIVITNASPVFEGVTVRQNAISFNSTGNAGAGVRIVSGAPLFSLCTFQSNDATLLSGGAVLNQSTSQPVFSQCTFSGNLASSGGAVYNTGTLRFEHCVFSGNSADTTPAIYSAGGSVSAFDTQFVSNHAVIMGPGAVRTAGVFVRCSFRANQGFDGGAIFGSPVLVNCVFAGNTANWPGTGGGAVKGSPTAINCVFVGNLCNGFGPLRGTAIDGSSPTLINSTLRDNVGGAAVLCASGAVISNSVFWMNAGIFTVDTQGAQITCTSGVPTINRCFVQGWTGTLGGTGNIGGGAGDDPRFLGGGEDVRLSRESPCIDAGDNALLPSDTLDLDNDTDTAEQLPIDLGGWYRRSDNPLVLDTGSGESPVVDMGAYEYRCPSDFNRDTFVNADDYDFFSDAFVAGSPSADFDGNGFVNGDDYDFFMEAFAAGC